MLKVTNDIEITQQLFSISTLSNLSISPLNFIVLVYQFFDF